MPALRAVGENVDKGNAVSRPRGGLFLVSEVPLQPKVTLLATTLTRQAPRRWYLVSIFSRLAHCAYAPCVVRCTVVDGTRQRTQIATFLALSQFIRFHHFGEPGQFPAPKLTDLYRTPSMGTARLACQPENSRATRVTRRLDCRHDGAGKPCKLDTV